MSTTIINAKIYTGENSLTSGFIRFSDKIETVDKMANYQEKTDDLVIDGKGNIIIPGFIDVHSHGGYGIDTMDADPKAINQMTEQMLQEGVTSYFPTTMTQADEKIEKSLAAVREAKKTNPMIQGIHLEGPFVSPQYRGAQPEKFMRDADVETLARWNEISGGNIRLVTYAPEMGDVAAFEEYCLEHNIILSAGHTGATYEQLIASQATHVTHLFNGQLGLHHREAGVAGYGLLTDQVMVEMIVDGFHISPPMVKLAYKAKGAEGIELITDSMRAKGLSEGESELGGQKVIVKDNQARLENGSLAGSVLTFNDAFKNIIRFTGCSIEEAVKMSSGNQAREFRLENKGFLTAEKDADLLILDKELTVEKTILGGTVHEFK